MPLYKIHPDKRTLTQVSRKKFSNEKELHDLIEKNLQGLLGIRVIAGEFPIPNGRIDTLGLDEDGLPVIIEYKWTKEIGAVIQGLFYLDWVMQNKRPFESIVRDKLGKDVVVDWSNQPRLLIIAQDFDLKELSAINQMGPRIELIKYSLYDGLFSYEYVNIVETKSPIEKTFQNHNEEIVSKPEHTIEELISKASPDIKDTFLLLRDKILSLSEGVWEKVGAGYCDYRIGSTFAGINVQKSQLKIYLKMGGNQIKDPQGICKPVPKNWGIGLLSTQFSLSRKDDVQYTMSLIKQAFDFVNG